MKKYSYIFDEIIDRTSTRDTVKAIIPVLIGWAKAGETDHTYGDLADSIRYKTPRLGHHLGRVNDVLNRLSELTGEVIPTPNSLVNNVHSNLPSDGFDFVKEHYSDMTKEDKDKYVRQLNSEAIHYDKWDWVLAQLGLKTPISRTEINEIRSGKVKGFGGEGPEHKALKEYVASHPKLVGAKENGETEHILLSGDRLDVWFPDSQIAVEVKPATSPDSDMLRGLFQCVKYKATLDAEASIEGAKPEAKVMMVIAGKLNESNKEIQNTLGVKVIHVAKYK